MIENDDETYSRRYFIGEQKELDEPQIVEIDKINPNTGKKMRIEYLYSNDLKKLNIDDFEKLAGITSDEMMQRIPVLKHNIESTKVMKYVNDLAKQSKN